MCPRENLVWIDFSSLHRMPKVIVFCFLCFMSFTVPSNFLSVRWCSYSGSLESFFRFSWLAGPTDGLMMRAPGRRYRCRVLDCCFIYERKTCACCAAETSPKTRVRVPDGPCRLTTSHFRLVRPQSDGHSRGLCSPRCSPYKQTKQTKRKKKKTKQNRISIEFLNCFVFFLQERL